MDVRVCGSQEEAARQASDLIARNAMFKPGLSLGAATGHDFEAVYAALSQTPVSLAWVRAVQLSEYLAFDLTDYRLARHSLLRSLIGPCGMQPYLALTLETDGSRPNDILDRHRRRLRAIGGLDIYLSQLKEDGRISSIHIGSPAITGKAGGGSAIGSAVSHSDIVSLSEIDAMSARAAIVLLYGEGPAMKFASVVSSRSVSSEPLAQLKHHPRLTVIADGAAASVLTDYALICSRQRASFDRRLRA